MATRELDRWLLNQGPYPEPEFGHSTDEGKMRFGASYGLSSKLYRCDSCGFESLVTSTGGHSPRMCPKTNCNGTQSETVRPANTSKRTTHSVTEVVCSCGWKAWRVGAQDFCDVYKCADGHITRYEVGKGLRTAWVDNT